MRHSIDMHMYIYIWKIFERKNKKIVMMLTSKILDYRVWSQLEGAFSFIEYMYKMNFYLKQILFSVILFICLGCPCFLAAWTFSSCCNRGVFFLVVCRILIAVASCIEEHSLQACGLQQLQHTASVVVVHGLCSSVV